ncbi:YtxH domain-containing protein [Schaalia sp. 19OD2882]|uniref:YtxH domain-containing protein n=1 Tax=Schaalia sp. 19OD2882 TaxID=2794089 RepID=UPI001C1F00DE|nr:YtxH domain-containing protein [Schaalia sp. 19OD2882]QWW19694.1 YtxH domain-containing protein [Schaalia sp. 19OD2882]
MGTKFGLVVGLGIGYVLGTRAGRERYETILAAARRVREIPVVAAPLDRAGEKISAIVRDQGERVTDKVADAVKERLFGMPAEREMRPSPAGTPGSVNVDVTGTGPNER